MFVNYRGVYRVGGVAAALLVLSVACTGVETGPAQPSPSSASSTAKVSVPARGALLGHYYGAGSIDDTDARIGRTPTIHLSYHGWFDDWVTARETRDDLAAGRIPLVNWEPFDISFDDIIAGRHDGPDIERNMLVATLAGESMTTPVSSKVERSARLLVDWATELVDTKRKDPGDDVFTHLLRLHTDGKMTKDELTSTYIVLLVGGMQVAVATGNGAFSFLTHPDQLAKALSQPDLITAGVDEIVRYESNFRFIAPHVTTQPLHLDGVTVPAGELVLLCLGAANRDPNQFDDPDTFDITRVTTGHLGFGHGRHRCLGEQLARTHVAIALRLFFERFPETALVDPPDQARWQPGKSQRRLESLPVIPF